jgi:hypothetical protein
VNVGGPDTRITKSAVFVPTAAHLGNVYDVKE